jgi:hypothetical protein
MLVASARRGKLTALVALARRGKLTALVALARRGKLTALVALSRRDTNRVAVAGISPGLSANNRGAVAGISPGLSASETPGLGVAGGIIHIYRVAVAAKQPMGVRQTNDGGCGETNDGFVAKRPTGGAAKRPMGVRQNDQRGRGKTTDGDVAKQPTGCAAKRTTGLWRNDQRGRNTDGLLPMRMNCRNRSAVISMSSPGIPHPRGFAGAQPRAISRNRSAVEYCQSCWFYWRISIALVFLVNTNHVGCVGEAEKTNRVGCISEAVKTNRVGCINEAGYQPRSGCGD